MSRARGRLSRIAAALIAATLSTSLAQAAEFQVRFASGGHARIPFDLRSQHIWVRGTLNGSDSLWIVVDTGATSSVMDQPLAKSLGLALEGEHPTLGAGGSQSGSSVANVTLALPGLTIHRDRWGTVDMSALGVLVGRPLQVVLGYELFAGCVVRFDYPAGVMDVWDPAHAPRDVGGVEVPMTLLANHPYVEGMLRVPGRPPLQGRYVIDTGSTGGLIVAPDVAVRESLTAAFPRTLEVVSRGVGGEVWNHVGRAESFSLADLRFDAPLVMVPQPTAGYISAPGTLGNIGGQLLGRCRVTFDYPRLRVRFEPGAEFDRPYEADMSGAVIQREPAKWTIRRVNPSSPAAEAGLREGDQVTRVDGQPVERMDPPAVRTLFQTEGRTVELGIRRDGRDSTATLVLRRLI